MRSYVFCAVAADGLEHRGLIGAQDEPDALARLRTDYPCVRSLFERDPRRRRLIERLSTSGP